MWQTYRLQKILTLILEISRDVFKISLHFPLLMGIGSVRIHLEIGNHSCHFKEEHWLHGCCKTGRVEKGIQRK